MAKKSYITQADELFLLAKKELNSAKRLDSEAIARDACGKAWIATTDALLGFLISKGVKEKQLPKSERQRHDYLATYGDEKMRLLYRSLKGGIHQEAYYDGIINYTFLFEALKNVKQFIYRCHNGTKNGSGKV